MSYPEIATRTFPCPTCRGIQATICNRCRGTRSITVCGECGGDPDGMYYVVRRIALTNVYNMRHLAHDQAHDYVTKDRIVGWKSTMHPEETPTGLWYVVETHTHTTLGLTYDEAVALMHGKNATMYREDHWSD